MNRYWKPIRARGEGIKRVGSGASLASGATTIPIASASSYYTGGQPVFVMDENGDNLSWCGKIQTVNTSNIIVAYPTNATYTTHYIVVPSKYVEFNCDYYEQAADIDTGVVNFESNASEIYRTQVKGDKEILTCAWAGMDDATWLAWRLFLQDAAGLNWGLNDVIFARHNPQFDALNVTRIRVLNESYSYKTVKTGLKSLSMRFIEISGIYL